MKESVIMSAEFFELGEAGPLSQSAARNPLYVMATSTKATEIKIRLPRVWKADWERIAKFQDLTLSDLTQTVFTRYLRNNGVKRTKGKSRK